jgi:hypothetical protein
MKKVNWGKIWIVLGVMALIAVIILTVLYRPKGSFTEFYFNEHTELPSMIDYATPFIASQEGPFLIVPNVSDGWKDVGDKANQRISSEPLNYADLNKKYNVSFTISSHEFARTKYEWNVTSSVLNKTGKFEIEPGKNMTINLTIAPEKAEWKLEDVKSENWHDILDITSNSWLAGGGAGEKLEMIADTSALRDKPVTHNVEYFGDILQTKLSFAELSAKPYTKIYEYSLINDSEKTYSLTTITLSVLGGKIIADINKTEIDYISKVQKFQINLTSNPGEANEKSQEIHFWYQIRQIGN